MWLSVQILFWATADYHVNYNDTVKLNYNLKCASIWKKKKKTNAVSQKDDSRRNFVASHETLPDWLFETHPLFYTPPVLNELWPTNTVQRAHSQRYRNRTQKKYTRSLKHKQQSYQMSLYFMFSEQNWLMCLSQYLSVI